MEGMSPGLLPAIKRNYIGFFFKKKRKIFVFFTDNNIINIDQTVIENEFLRTLAVDIN